MTKTKSGFTIVELLIVIVVIGILAAITIVAYNGIQTRAKNIKTVNAASSWVKALRLYQADKGSLPPSSSCLGSSTTYIGAGGECWNGYTVTSSFLTAIQPYVSNYPEPDTTNVESTAMRRGILYDTNNSSYWAMYILLSGTGTCPNIGIDSAQTGVYSSGYYCLYYLT